MPDAAPPEVYREAATAYLAASRRYDDLAEATRDTLITIYRDNARVRAAAEAAYRAGLRRAADLLKPHG